MRRSETILRVQIAHALISAPEALSAADQPTLVSDLDAQFAHQALPLVAPPQPALLSLSEYSHHARQLLIFVLLDTERYGGLIRASFLREYTVSVDTKVRLGSAYAVISIPRGSSHSSLGTYKLRT